MNTQKHHLTVVESVSQPDKFKDERGVPYLWHDEVLGGDVISLGLFKGDKIRGYLRKPYYGDLVMMTDVNHPDRLFLGHFIKEENGLLTISVPDGTEMFNASSLLCVERVFRPKVSKRKNVYSFHYKN